MVLRIIGTMLTTAALLIVGFVIAMAVERHRHTGRWELPTWDHVEINARALQSTLFHTPTKLIYLHRGPLTLRPGVDDATTATSSVLASIPGPAARRVGGFRGSDSRWRRIKRCVIRGLAPFDVTVTDQRPAPSTSYMLVAVGGRGRDIGLSRTESRRTGGLAPLRAGRPVPRAVVFAFARTLRNRVRPVCETILHEIGHAYGLEHVRSCKDLMGYGTHCGRRRFVDAPKTCGERRSRSCATGRSTQNAFDYLMNLLGPRQPESAAANPDQRHEDHGEPTKSNALTGGA